MDRWFWLAIIISGSSHAVKIRRGEDRESEKKVGEKIRPLSFVWLRVKRTIKLMIRLWADGLIQIIELLENHVRGARRIVGRMIFSIGGC